MYNNEALYFTTTVILVDDDPSFLKNPFWKTVRKIYCKSI